MFNVDERIEALFDDDENWYSGRIAATLDAYHYDVEYDDGDFRAAVPLREIRYRKAVSDAVYRPDSLTSSAEGRATNDDDIQAARTNDSTADTVDGILAGERPPGSLHPKNGATQGISSEYDGAIPNLSSVDGGIIDDGMDDILDGILRAENADTARLGESKISQELARALSDNNIEYEDDYDSEKCGDNKEATVVEASENKMKSEAHAANVVDILSSEEEQNRNGTSERTTRADLQIGCSNAAYASSTEEVYEGVSCKSDCTGNIKEGHINSSKNAAAPMPARKLAQNSVKLAPSPKISPEIEVNSEVHCVELDLTNLVEGKSDAFVAERVEVGDKLGQPQLLNLLRSSRSPQSHIARLSQNQHSSRHSMTTGMRMTRGNHAARRPKSASLGRSKSTKLNRVRPLSGIQSRETKSHNVLQVLPDVVADTSVPHRGWDGLKRWLDEECKLREAAGYLADQLWIEEAPEHLRPRSAPRSRSTRNGTNKPPRDLRVLEEGFDLRFRSSPPIWARRS